MPTIGERLWDMGKSPPQFITFVLFGLFALLAGVILRSFFIWTPGASVALALVASILGGIGGFFLASALFLGAYAGVGESNGFGFRIAQLIGAVVLVVVFLLV